MLAVKNEACGVTVYVSGDAKTATPDSLWRIGSITKTFTSAVILSLAREGKLSLDDALAKWVPGVRNTDGVTVRMLLNHTSGIFNYTESSQLSATSQVTPEQIVSVAVANPPYFKPGQGFHYSNTNYVLLGMIAERAGGAKIGALMHARAIGKAKLAHTFFDGEDSLGGTLARGFDDKNQDVTLVPNPSVPWAAGAMAASGADLATWVSELYGTDDVLDAETRAVLTANPVQGYGLGVEILPATATHGAGQGLGHDGSILGFHSQAFYFADTKTVIAAVVNSDAADPNDISVAAVNVLFGP